MNKKKVAFICVHNSCHGKHQVWWFCRLRVRWRLSTWFGDEFYKNDGDSYRLKATLKHIDDAGTQRTGNPATHQGHPACHTGSDVHQELAVVKSATFVTMTTVPSKYDEP